MEIRKYMEKDISAMVYIWKVLFSDVFKSHTTEEAEKEGRAYTCSVTTIKIEWEE